jgi:hypothetical protein
MAAVGNPFRTNIQWSLVLRVDGLTDDDVQRGIDAAKRMLETNRLDPIKGYEAYKMLSLQWHDIIEMGMSLQELQQYKEACCWADAWASVQDAAVKTACQALPNGAIAFWFGLEYLNSEPLDDQTFYKTDVQPLARFKEGVRFNGVHTKQSRQNWGG